jgi:hypothetical protein
LLFDIDRASNLDAAMADARILARFLRERYGPNLDDGLAVYFSGSKGFHIFAELLFGWAATVTVPLVCKRLALMIAARAGVQIDTSCYDRQRIVRLPNSKHPTTGLYKRFLSFEELFRLDLPRIKELARHPAGFPLPMAGEHIPQLEDDWIAAATPEPSPTVRLDTGHPVVPKFVRDFIGFEDVQDPGRALTVFRCSASLAEAGTPEAVIFGLLEEPALKTGLEQGEVRRQILSGIEHAHRKGGAA